MIIDTIANLDRYACLSPNFARAARFLRETPPASHPLGDIPVDGENVFASLSEGLTEAGERPFEAHDLYADIQVILSGSERFALGVDPVLEPLLPGKDLRWCHAEKSLSFTLEAEQFVIFFPGEAHAPGGAAEEPANRRKMVIKVLCPAG